jgi:histidinol phosphatase-like PHP family hydrolase
MSEDNIMNRGGRRRYAEEANEPPYARYDYHIHTFRSPCGEEENTPAAVVRCMEALGFAGMGFSDHLHPHTDPEGFQETRKDVDKAKPAIQVFIGCEAELLGDGRSTITASLAAALDYVLLAPNHYHLAGFRLPSLPKTASAVSFVVERHLEAASCPLADVVVHPFTGIDTLGHDPDLVLKAITDGDLEEIVRAASANDAAFELSRRALDLSSSFMLRFYRLCRDAGVPLVACSDAHNLTTLGCTRKLASLARRIGLEAHHFRKVPMRHGSTTVLKPGGT